MENLEQGDTRSVQFCQWHSVIGRVEVGKTKLVSKGRKIIMIDTRGQQRPDQKQSEIMIDILGIHANNSISTQASPSCSSVYAICSLFVSKDNIFCISLLLLRCYSVCR